MLVYRRGDLTHIARSLRVLDELRGFRRGRRIDALARELKASERTIRRDLAELRSVGFEIEPVLLEGRAGARLVEKTYSTIAITRRERYTLLAIASMFDVLRGTPLWEDVQSLQQKLEQRMTAEERAEHATLGERFAYVPDGGTKAYAGSEEVLDALMTGVLSRRVVKFAYRGARGRVRRGLMAPLTMILFKHGLYVIACVLDKPGDAPRLPAAVYAVERFSEAEHVRKAAFVPPPEFRLGDLLHGAFGIHVVGPRQRVVVEVSAAKAELVRARVWHPAQQLETLADGRVRLACPCASLAPVVSWVLEWGPHATAIEPPALVAEIVRELEAARRNYG